MSMKRNLTLAALLLASLLWLDAAFARDDDCGIERNVKAKPLDESTWQRLNRIYEFVGEENYQQARDDLLSLEKRARGNRYLEAIVYQALAQVQWSLEDFDAALSSFERAVELDALPDEPHFSLMYQIAQLYYMKGRYTDALERLRVWFCKSPPERIKADAYVLEASIHAQLKNWQKLIDAIDKAIAMDEEPRENWYQLKLAANFELEDFPAAADTLEVMIRRWPAKKLYWTQLSNVWFKLEQNDKALAVMALAYRNHLLDTQSDYLYLSNL